MDLAYSVTNVSFALLIAKKIKERSSEVAIIFGGPHATIHAPELMKENDFLDFVIVGEGENSFRQLAEYLLSKPRDGSIIEGIEGIWRRKGDKVHWSGFSSPIKRLDTLPFPDFSDLCLSHYSTIALPLALSRGCVAKCTYCMETNLWRPYRERSVKNVIEEIVHHMERYQTISFLMHDSSVNGNIQKIEELAEQIIQRNIRIRWGGYARIKGMNAELLNKLYQSGCRWLFYGIESANQRILNLMRKDTTLEEIVQVLRWTKESGIRGYGNFIIGFPSETQRECYQTLNFILNHRECLAGVSLTPFHLPASSECFLRPEKFGIKKVFKTSDALGIPESVMRLIPHISFYGYEDRGELEKDTLLSLVTEFESIIHGEYGIPKHTY